jgi:DNA-binding XRE family transcriptional regulator
MTSVTYHAAAGVAASPRPEAIDYVCRAIRMYRERLDLTRPELGAAIGASGFAVGAWERGESLPSSDDIDRMATCFSVTSVALRSPCASHLRETVLVVAPSLQPAR